MARTNRCNYSAAEYQIIINAFLLWALGINELNLFACNNKRSIDRSVFEIEEEKEYFWKLKKDSVRLARKRSLPLCVDWISLKTEFKLNNRRFAIFVNLFSAGWPNCRDIMGGMDGKKLNEFTSRHRSPRRRPISARVIKRSLINKETSDCFPGLLLECRVVAASLVRNWTRVECFRLPRINCRLVAGKQQWKRKQSRDRVETSVSDLVVDQICSFFFFLEGR